MNLRISAAVYQKELLEIFRDRRTMISMVVVRLVAAAWTPILEMDMSNSLDRIALANEMAAGQPTKFSAWARVNFPSTYSKD